VSLIVNPAAGSGRAERVLPEVRAGLDEVGLEYRVQRTRSLAHARELAHQALAAGETAVALSGDGVLGVIADVFKHTGQVLGVLPGGRGNDFARSLGIPLSPRAACRVLASGVPRLLDLGQVADRTFIGIASCGFDSDANRIANETRLVRGKLVYTYGGLRALVSWKPARFRVVLDGGPPRTITGYTIAAANSTAYGGGMMLAPDASLDDGLLDVVLISEISKLRFARLLPTVFKGEHVKLPNVEVLRARELEVSADRPFDLYADGEPIASLPVTIRCLPRAVQVLAPSPSR
jgi:YegS/Rv2252/BmrU family lipid kinase